MAGKILPSFRPLEIAAILLPIYDLVNSNKAFCAFLLSEKASEASSGNQVAILGLRQALTVEPIATRARSDSGFDQSVFLYWYTCSSHQAVTAILSPSLCYPDCPGRRGCANVYTIRARLRRADVPPSEIYLVAISNTLTQLCCSDNHLCHSRVMIRDPSSVASSTRWPFTCASILYESGLMSRHICKSDRSHSTASALR